MEEALFDTYNEELMFKILYSLCYTYEWIDGNDPKAKFIEIPVRPGYVKLVKIEGVD